LFAVCNKTFAETKLQTCGFDPYGGLFFITYAYTLQNNQLITQPAMNILNLNCWYKQVSAEIT